MNELKCCCDEFEEWHNSARLRFDGIYWILCTNSEFEKDDTKWRWHILRRCPFCEKKLRVEG